VKDSDYFAQYEEKGGKFAFSEFNCVDLCHDAAKHASMMALAAPSVVATQQ
jgi:hypothetical protein